ncbi:MAG TPA: hypothetical protein VKU41_06635 [Polyangiaceae bacterium]|nr:hypothetical protein [Polyangiaceae bacterium]
MRSRRIVAAVAMAAPVAFVLLAPGEVARAQRPPAAAKPHPAPRAPAHRPTTAPDAAAPTPSGPAALAPAQPTTLPAANGQLDAGVVESKTLDGGTHVFKFSELDIEGRLKSPQLVYFLRRVRAEFAAGDLGHRTFMREMSETRKEPSF